MTGQQSSLGPSTRIAGCARCRDDHESVAFKPLARPMFDPDGDYTHWAPCPTNGDPILMRIVEDENA